MRSDGQSIRCSPSENAAQFAATVGGLGLTGLIVSAEIALRRIESAAIVAEQIPFRGLREFDSLSRESDSSHEYTVAWFDAFGGREPRGIFFRGNHSNANQRLAAGRRAPRRLPVRLFSPFLTPLTLRLFNEAYFQFNVRPRARVIDYDPFFYPLDTVANWNRIYGPKGFLQYQFVIPEEAGLGPVGDVLDRVSRSRIPSFLTVIKRFGGLRSPGMLSFPRAGITVCFDFAAGSHEVKPLLDELDGIVLGAGGAIYPAKDARMTAATFRRSFAQCEEFARHIDPRFSSSFWRRVTS
jgi:FAD/FMN-containing dehydrogenase